MPDETPEELTPDPEAAAVLITGIILVAAVAAVFFWSDIKQMAQDARASIDPAYAEQLAEDRAEAERKAAEEAAADKRATDNILAQVACQRAVRARVKFPSKASFDPGMFNIATVGPLQSDPSITGVRGTVELMNGFGAMVPHRYACNLQGERALKVLVQPGG